MAKAEDRLAQSGMKLLEHKSSEARAPHLFSRFRSCLPFITGLPGGQERDPERFAYVKGYFPECVYLGFMFSLAQHHNTLADLQAEIADAERLLASSLERLAKRRDAGEATYELERDVRNCRFALENLWAVRQQHLRAEVVAAA